MDSQQSSRKRGNFDVVSLEGALNNNEDGENDEFKRRKLETNPLELGCILEKIFSFLDAASIKNARQVKKLWSLEGAKMLINKCFVTIPRTCRELEMSRIVKNMDEFRAFLSIKSEGVLMIPHITVNVFDDVELWKYFGVVGQQVKSIQLSYRIVAEGELFSNLLDLLPNLAHLSFPCHINNNYGYYGRGENIKMNVFTAVTSKAAKGAPFVISHMTLEVGYEEQLAEAEKFADCNNIMIQDLKLVVGKYFSRDPQMQARILNVISKLLFTSRNTLKRLSLPHCELYLSILEFPTMSGLTHLKLKFNPKYDDDLQQCKFSPSFRFPENIPDLHSVEIVYGGIRPIGDFFGNVLENSGTAPSVQELKYVEPNFRLNIDPLFQTFPSIKGFEIRQTGCSHSDTVFRSLWQHGRNVKKLNIIIEVKDSNDKVGDLDSILTGFAPSTVEGLKSRYQLENLETLRVNPSLLNLQELEDLTICINRTSRWAEPFIPTRSFVVAGEHAVKLLPKKPTLSIHVGNETGTLTATGLKRALAEVSKLSYVSVEIEDPIHYESDDD